MIHPALGLLVLALGLAGPAQTNPCACPNATDVKIGGYLGQRLDACLEHNVKTTDGQYLTAVFKSRKETNTWQTEFWGKWMHSAVPLNKYSREAAFTLKLRIPAWSSKTTVAVNGEPCTGVMRGTYLPLARHWKAGDTVALKLELVGRCRMKDNHFALERGPITSATSPPQGTPGPRSRPIACGSGLRSTSCCNPMFPTIVLRPGRCCRGRPAPLLRRGRWRDPWLADGTKWGIMPPWNPRD